VDFRVLGPLEVQCEGEPVQVAAGKQRALLARLLLYANRAVSREQIVDALWSEDPPETAHKMVQIHVSQLRKSLPEARLHTRAPGYLLEVRDEELDLARFARAVADGRQALLDDDPVRARDLLADALSLWRGPALADIDEPFARHERARLDELRLAALELRLEADLALARHDEVVGELESVTAEHPLRERLRAQQMVALYRSGRQAEALAAFQTFRRMLADELGIEPSASLRELERRMLQQDPALEPARPAAPRENEVAYARSGDVRIAYQVVGSGPLDLVHVHGWVCTFQPGWERPSLASYYRRLASFGRLILFDKRGTGLSDRVSPERLPDLETRMDDVRAVLDAVGSTRAVVLGHSEGGAMSALFAATYPERTAALILMGTFARTMRAPDYLIGWTEEELRMRLGTADEDDWATAMTEEWLGRVAPDLLHDPAAKAWYRSYLQRSASPAASRAVRQMNSAIDVRDVLPTIGVPTLVIYRSGEHFGEATRYMGERIPGARIVELPGNDHLPWEGDQEGVLEAIGAFLADDRQAEADTVLATLLVTHAVQPEAADGRSWADLLALHRRVVRAELARFRGRELELDGETTTSAFDGPARATRCAAAIVRAAGGVGLEVRAGVHTGEIARAGGAGGETAHGARGVAGAAPPGEVYVSGIVRDLVAGSGLVFEQPREGRSDGGPHEVWRLTG
jgi:DNA-binding SARP family transcriptional activator/pimeloyl-ACP methyl ester carboxylesterase